MSKNSYLKALAQSNLFFVFVRSVGAGSISLAWYILAFFEKESELVYFAKFHSQLLFVVPLIMLGKDILAYRRSVPIGVFQIQKVDLSLFFIMAVVFILISMYSSSLETGVIIVSVIIALTYYMVEGFRVINKIWAYTLVKFVAFNIYFSIAIFFSLLLDDGILTILSFFSFSIFFGLFVIGSKFGVFSISSDLGFFEVAIKGIMIYLPQSGVSFLLFYIYNLHGYDDFSLGQFALIISVVSLLGMIQSVFYVKNSNSMVSLDGAKLKKLYWEVLYRSSLFGAGVLLCFVVFLYILSSFELVIIYWKLSLFYLLAGQLLNLLSGPVFLLLNLKGKESLSLLVSIISLLIVFYLSFTISDFDPFVFYGTYVILTNSIGLIFVILYLKRA